MLRSPEHVALHEVVVAAELVQIHSGGSDHPDVSVGETLAQSESDLLQTPAEPLSSFRLHRHLLLEVLTQQQAGGDDLKLQENFHTLININVTSGGKIQRVDSFYKRYFQCSDSHEIQTTRLYKLNKTTRIKKL